MTRRIQEITEEPIPEDIEFDIVVRMPPVKEQCSSMSEKYRKSYSTRSGIHSKSITQLKEMNTKTIKK